MSPQHDRPTEANALGPTDPTVKLSTTFLPSVADGVAVADAPPPAEQFPAELLSLKQYQIIEELGYGGMGRVYLAKDLPLDRDVVIKVVNTDRVQRAETLERFAREMRVAAKLHHPNVVAAYTSHQAGECLVFVMEYVPGIDLSKLVKSHGRISPLKVAYYASQVARGLKHAHEHHLVHRDVKPSNLMLVKHGKKHTVKILDFGLAKAWSECEKGEELTGAGCMLGTPEYVAPEQIRDAAHADIRADLYSLGCTMYFLLTGEPPFRGRSEFELQEAHVFKKAPCPSLIRPEVPQVMAKIVTKLMAKSPEDRYQTPAELLTALSEHLRACSSPTSDILQFPSEEEPSPLPPTKAKPAQAAITKTGLTTTEMPQPEPLRRDRWSPGPQEVLMLPRALAVTPPPMKPLSKEELFLEPPNFPDFTPPEPRVAGRFPTAGLLISYVLGTVAFAAYLLTGRLTSGVVFTSVELCALVVAFVCFAGRNFGRFGSRSWWLGACSLSVLAGLLLRNVIPVDSTYSLATGWLVWSVLALAAAGRHLANRRANV